MLMVQGGRGYFSYIIVNMILWVGSALLVGCGGSSGDTGDGLVSQSYYVDANTGDDLSGTGSSVNPFKTISKAVSESTTSNTVINVLPGTYNAALGEMFPIILDSSISLVGGGATADEVTISGSGSYTSSAMQVYDVAVVLNGSNKIDNLEITASSQTGIVVDNSQNIAKLSNSRFVGSNIGVVLEASTRNDINNSAIEGNVTGLVIQDGSTVTLRRNQIRNNSVGAYIDALSDANIGTRESSGRNTIELNAQCDLLSESDIDIHALGNIWDVNEFSFNVTGICTGGANIVATGIGTVFHQFIPASTSPIFPGATLITSNTPAFGQLISTDSPTMGWIPTGQSLVLAIVFDHPVIVSGRSIQNTGDIIWLWHSGLGNAIEGDIPFSEGVSIVNGNINQPLPPQPLDAGRTYYWLVMAWDNAGTAVTHASYHNYFITAP